MRAPTRDTHRGRWALQSLSVLLAVGCGFTPGAPSVSVVTLSTGEKFDVISISQSKSVGNILGDSVVSKRPAVVIDYYSKATGLDSEEAAEEAQKLIEVAVPSAHQSNDSLIVVRQTKSIGPRATMLVEGRMYFYVPAKRTYAFGNDREKWERMDP